MVEIEGLVGLDIGVEDRLVVLGDSFRSAGFIGVLFVVVAEEEALLDIALEVVFAAGGLEFISVCVGIDAFGMDELGIDIVEGNLGT